MRIQKYEQEFEQDNDALLEEMRAMFENVVAENEELAKRISILEEEILYEQTEKQYLLKTQTLNQLIVQAGGKNVKAITALLELDTDIPTEEDYIVAIENVKREAPYLFIQKQEKIGGTGYTRTNTRANTRKNEISTAFKTGLQI